MRQAIVVGGLALLAVACSGSEEPWVVEPDPSRTRAALRSCEDAEAAAAERETASEPPMHEGSRGERRGIKDGLDAGFGDRSRDEVIAMIRQAFDGHPGFSGLWLDSNGGLTVGFTETHDEQLRARLARLVGPRAVRVEVMAYSEVYLRDLQDRLTEGLSIPWSAIGARENLGVVEVDLPGEVDATAARAIAAAFPDDLDDLDAICVQGGVVIRPVGARAS